MVGPAARVKLTGTACVSHKDDQLLPARAGVLPQPQLRARALLRNGEGGEPAAIRAILFAQGPYLPTIRCFGDSPSRLPNQGQGPEASHFLLAGSQVFFRLASPPLLVGFSEPDSQIRSLGRGVWLLPGEQEERIVGQGKATCPRHWTASGRALLASGSWPTTPFPCVASFWPGPRCRAWEQGSNQALLSAQLLVRKAGLDGDLAEK